MITFLIPVQVLFMLVSVYSADTTIVIQKSLNRLLVTSNGILKAYKVVLGKQTGRKQKKGDEKTPTGVYKIIGRNDQSKYHLFLHLNYPNNKDALTGLDSGLIDSTIYNEIISANRKDNIPPQNTPLGGYIGIHGLGKYNDMYKFARLFIDIRKLSPGCCQSRWDGNRCQLKS